MEAIICPSCKAVHNANDINSVDVCDTCKKQIVGKRYDCTSCYNSSDYTHYCKDCVTKLEGSWYCAAHKVRREKVIEANTIIQKYSHSFWEELGGKVIEYKRKDTWRRGFKVEFEALTLSVEVTPQTKNGAIDEDDDDVAVDLEVLSLDHKVEGIKEYGSSTFRAGIHSHDDALKQVVSALIRSLRSKKSSLTVERNKLEADKSYHLRGLHRKQAASRWRSLLSPTVAKRRKIDNMSNFLRAKLKELETPKVEPVSQVPVLTT